MWNRFVVFRLRPRDHALGKRGFTLVEVLVSLMVLGVALMSLWGFHWTSHRVNMKAKREATALMLANEKLEELRRAASAGQSIDNETGTEALDNQTKTGMPDGVVFIRQTSIATDAVNDWRANVTVSVRWTEQRGEEGQVVLQTVVAP